MEKTVQMEVPEWEQLKNEINKRGLKHEFIRTQLDSPISQSSFSKMLGGVTPLKPEVAENIRKILQKYPTP